MPTSDDREVIESIGLFEAAVRAEPVTPPAPELRSIAVALDGSNQDDTARRWATAIGQRTAAAVAVRSNLRTAREILAFRRETNAGLLVLPVPFGLDIGDLKDESLGSVVDLLLSESPSPVLCVRQLMDDAAIDSALARIVLPLGVHRAPWLLAAGWARRLLGRHALLEVLMLVDRDALDEARRLVGAAASPEQWEEAALGRAIAAEHAGLIAHLQRQSDAAGYRMQLQVECGRPAELALDLANNAPSLIIAAHDRDHESPAFHLADDLVLGARSAVLVV